MKLNKRLKVAQGRMDARIIPPNTGGQFIKRFAESRTEL